MFGSTPAAARRAAFAFFRPAMTAAAVAAVLACTALPVAALPDAERVTLSPSAGAMIWSEWSDVHDDYYYGGGFGFMFGRHWGVEGMLGWSPSIQRSDGAKSMNRHLGLDLRYQIWDKRWFNPYVSAGWAEVRLDRDGPGGAGDYNGWEFGGGVLFPFREGPFHRISARIDARDVMVKFDPPRPSDDSFHHNFLFTAGVQVEFGDNYHRDADGDGVIGRVDECGGTPPGVIVDAKGCPIDSDGDGIFDGLDQCESTPAGAVIDSLGCPIDSDGDGVYDGLDECEGTPKGAIVDAKGCPSDADGDRVFDGIDECPDTPRSVRVDAKGCPRIDSEEERALIETGTLALTGIEFESGKAELKPGADSKLLPVGDAMRKWPELKLEIGGHTDSRGSETFNQKLSQERADAVKAFLMEKYDFVTEDRLTAVGYGEASPVASNDTDEGRAQNRRVEFKITAGTPKLPGSN